MTGQQAAVRLPLLRWLAAGLRVLLLVLLCLACLYQVAGRYLVSQVERFHLQIESELGSLLQRQVQIGQIGGSWHGWSPAIQAHGVTIGDADASLQVQELLLQPDMLRSLRTLSWHIDGLAVHGLQLELVEDDAGQWQILRQSLVGDEQQSEAFSLAVLRRINSFALLDSQLRVVPSNAPAFEFANVGLVLDRRHGQRIQASIGLPDQQQIKLEARGRLDSNQWSDTSFDLFVQLPDADLAQWLPDDMFGLQLDQLRLAGNLWLQVRGGQVAEGQARIASGALHGSWQQQQLQLQLGQVAANYVADARQRKLWFDQLQLGFAQDAQLYDWPLVIGQEQFGAADPGIIRLQAAQLDIAPIAELLQRLLPNAVAREVFATLAPSGQLRNTSVRWQQAAPWPERLSFDTNLAAVAYSPWESVPGASGINGRVFGGLSGGELQLDTSEFSLYLADFFAEPWDYEQAGARLLWQLDQEGFRLISPYLQVRGAEGEIAGDFDIRMFFDQPHMENYMDLRVGLRGGDAGYVAKYLPLVLQEEQAELDSWLRTSIRSGQAHQGYFQYQGSISSNSGSNSRSISLFFDAGAVQLDYQPGWPQLNQADAKVYIHDWGVEVELERGRILETRVLQAQAEVLFAPADQASMLTVQAQLESNVADGLHLLQQTPLAAELSEFAHWRGTGQVPASFVLQLPLGDGQPPRVQFDLQLDNAGLQLTDLGLELERLRGRLEYDSASGLNGQQLGGVFLQQPFTLDVTAKQMGEQWINQIQASGSMDGASLRQWLLPEIGLPVSGLFDYQLLLNIDGSDSQLVVESDFAGVTLDLPAPFGKSAAQKIPVAWRMSLAGRERHMSLGYGQLLELVAVSVPQEQGLRAGLMLGPGKASLPVSQGLRVDGRLGLVMAQEWWQLLESGLSTAGQSDLPLLQQASLTLGQVQGLPLELNDVQLKFVRDNEPGAWQLRLDAANLVGSLQKPAGDGPLQLSIERLRLPAAAGEPHKTEPEEATVANWPWQLLPALSLELQQLYQADELLGRVRVDLRQQDTVTRLDNIDLQLRGLGVTGNADWQQDMGRSSFAGQLSGADIGKVLKAWGYTPTLSSNRFAVDVDMNWPGQPQQAVLTSLDGELALSLRNGQIYEVDSGARALRVFGLLNFNSIGRRLRLDFSDLFGKGLSYDHLRGKLRFEHGLVYSVEPFVLKGISSELDLAGQVDLASRQIQARLDVAIPVSNNLPLAAIIVGAPAVGGALFLVDRLAGNKINRFASVSYLISGDWQDPEVSLLERKDKK